MNKIPIVISAYLRDGRVHANRDAYEGGDGIADYRYEIGPQGKGKITTIINGRYFRSLWAWQPDDQKSYGYISLIEENK